MLFSRRGKAIAPGRKAAAGGGASRRIAAFLEYLLMLTALLECNSMFTYATQTAGRVDMYLLFYRVALPLAALLLALRVLQNPKALRQALPYGAVLAAMMAYALAFYMLNVRGLDAWKKQNYIMNFMLLLPMLAAYFKLRQQEGRGLELLHKYSDIVCALAGLSLVVYVASVVRMDSVPADVIYTRWNDRSVTMAQINLLDVCQSVMGVKWQMFGISLLRNRSVFTEPPMFSLQLFMALYAELFLCRRAGGRRVARAVLLTVALLTVNATIGLMLMALAWCIRGVSACLRGRRRWLVIPILLAALCACGVLYLEKDKVSYEDTEASGSSLSTHIDDYRVSLKGFAQKPLLGGGYQDEDYIRGFMREYRLEMNPGLSNSAGVILAEGGIMLGLMCMLPFGICLAYLFRRRERHVGCWAIGALGAYIAVIFHFHQFLMLLMAFGYSLLDVRRAKRGFRLALVDTTAQSGGAVEAERGRASALRAVAAIAAGAALACFGAPVWRALHAFLRIHQFSVGQAPLRAFCFAAALLLNAVSLRDVLRGRLATARLIGLLAWDAVYLLLYPALFSAAGTLMQLCGVWGELRECALLLAIYIVPAALILLLTPNGWHRRHTVLAVTAAAAVCACALIANDRMARFESPEAPLVSELEDIAASASGEVYVNDLPLLYHRQVKGVSLSATRDSGFDVCENASIVFPAGSERRELLENGFQLTRLEDGSLLYSNDDPLVAALGERGAHFYRYYPYGHAVNLRSLASLNYLSRTEDGAVIVDGPVESLFSGPYDTLFPGEYTAVYDLWIDLSLYAGMPGGTRVCRASLMWDYGEEPLAQKSVTLDGFDEAGHAAVELPFRLVRTADGVEYQLVGEADFRIEVRSIAICQTPSRVTITSYNSHRDPVREAYYDADGAPSLRSGSYAALERDFDMADRVKAIRYFGADGAPVLHPDGYAQVRYGYNRKGSRNFEAYFGTDGAPILRAAGYASVRTEFDAYGNPTLVRYFDTNGEPVVSADGYAAVRRQYDDRRQCVREDYLDAEGNPIARPTGEAALEREYDANGYVCVYRCLDAQNRRVLTAYGYAELHRTLDGAGRVLEETYLGADGLPHTKPAGYCGIVQAFDDEGHLLSRRYLDANGDPAQRTDGYAEARFEYDGDGAARSLALYDLSGAKRETDGVNLALDAASDWSEWMTPQTNRPNASLNFTWANLGQKQAGDAYTCQIEIEFRGVRATEGHDFGFRTQGATDGQWGIGNVWDRGLVNLKEAPQDGVYRFQATRTLTEEMAAVSDFDIGFRCDYWAGGAFRVRRIKVERGDTASAWTPGI